MNHTAAGLVCAGKRRSSGAYAKRPLWTYFTVAHAHQWLFLDQPDNVWKTLRYLWDNQCSPGLYTFWEGEKEENSFGLWQHLARLGLSRSMSRRTSGRHRNFCCCKWTCWLMWPNPVPSRCW